MSDHQRKADSVETEIDELQNESSELKDEIAGTREDWERKKGDDNVPGAGRQAAGGGVRPAA